MKQKSLHRHFNSFKVICIILLITTALLDLSNLFLNSRRVSSEMPIQNHYSNVENFSINATFPLEFKEFYTTSKQNPNLQFWGSWIGSSDNTAYIQSESFTCPKYLKFFVSGHPGNPNNHIFLINDNNSNIEIYSRSKAFDPGTKWEIFIYKPDQSLINHQVRLAVHDESIGWGGWIGFSDPMKSSLLEYAWLKFKFLPKGSVTIICIIFICYLCYGISAKILEYLKYLSTSDELKNLLIISIFSLFIFFLRRPTQFLSPSVWAEEGTVVIPDFFTHGIISLFYPVNGYLILITKLISGFALLFPISFYPYLTLFLSVLFELLVILAIVYTPTLLKARIVCAIFLLFLPINSEVYVSTLYTFWFASILVFLVALWDDKGDLKTTQYSRISIALQDKRVAISCVYLIVGGLSSPIIVFLSPLIALRFFYQVYLMNRRISLRSIISDPNFPIFVSLNFCTALQLVNILQTSSSKQDPIQISGDFIISILGRFFGFLVSHSDYFETQIFLGTILFLFLFSNFFRIVSKYFKYRKTEYNVFQSLFAHHDIRLIVTLYYLLSISILATLLRVGGIVDVIHPRLAGPRYFFFPYLVITWILIQFSLSNGRPTLAKLASNTFLALILFNSFSTLVRIDQPLDWQSPSLIFRYEGSAKFPVNTDGNIDSVITVLYPPSID